MKRSGVTLIQSLVAGAIVLIAAAVFFEAYSSAQDRNERIRTLDAIRPDLPELEVTSLDQALADQGGFISTDLDEVGNIAVATYVMPAQNTKGAQERLGSAVMSAFGTMRGDVNLKPYLKTAPNGENYVSITMGRN